MWFQHRAWIPAAWILSGLNIAATWFAAGDAQPLHAASHALLAALFALGAQRLQVRALRADTAEARLAEVEERVDFTERALVEVRQRAQLPPKA